MSYLGELRVNWRFLTAASVGLGSGYMFSMYLNSLFAPHLLEEFGWTKSQFALIGLTILSGVIFMPIAGRLTDGLGTRKAATIGVVASPLIYIALATMGGSFTYFLLLHMLQLMLVGSFTTVMVYNRLIAEQFDRSRGLALAIAACTPSVVAAAVAPLLTRFIENFGWRYGYVALAVAVTVAGVIALVLIPRGGGDSGSNSQSSSIDLPALVRNPSFQILCLCKLLCAITVAVMSTQLQLVLLDRNLGAALASVLISVYAMATIGGRFLGGLGVDRFPAHIVGVFAYGIVPAAGLFILGSGLQSPVLVGAAVLIVGIGAGADSIVTAYLIMRFFRFEIFSTVYSLISVAIALSAAGGSLLLSVTIKATGGFDLFFMVAALTVLCGGLPVLLLGRQPPAVREQAPAG